MAVTPPRIGNDVVDLHHPRVPGKEADARFLERVLAPGERSLLRRTEAPELLWILWGAKEAAFKAACKAGSSSRAFRPRAFRVEPREEASGPAGPAVRGSVRHESHTYAFEARRTADWIHVVALPATGAGSDALAVACEVSPLPEAPAGWPETWRRRFSEREWEAVYSFPSAVVRLRCRRAVAAELEIAEERLEIVPGARSAGRPPPLLLLDGKPSAADVSLSHHGRFVAWSFPRPLPPVSTPGGSSGGS